jgi:hypothetical protein
MVSKFQSIVKLDSKVPSLYGNSNGQKSNPKTIAKSQENLKIMAST